MITNKQAEMIHITPLDYISMDPANTRISLSSEKCARYTFE